mmetsp:Transcript_7351/g.26828  ORF Transcript_7351/g.26828 Transcript_7351/m.26828 type:complete len:292 (-) Transcript_7351:1519-2394(-)
MASSTTTFISAAGSFARTFCISRHLSDCTLAVSSSRSRALALARRSALWTSSSMGAAPDKAFAAAAASASISCVSSRVSSPACLSNPAFCTCFASQFDALPVGVLLSFLRTFGTTFFFGFAAAAAVEAKRFACSCSHLDNFDSSDVSSRLTSKTWLSSLACCGGGGSSISARARSSAIMALKYSIRSRRSSSSASRLACSASNRSYVRLMCAPRPVRTNASSRTPSSMLKPSPSSPSSAPSPSVPRSARIVGMFSRTQSITAYTHGSPKYACAWAATLAATDRRTVAGSAS